MEISVDFNKRASAADRLEHLELNVTLVVGELAKLRKTLNKHDVLMQVVDEHKAVKTLNRISARVQELSDLLQVEILKQTVCSEVSRTYPEVWPQVVMALDQPNEWWRKGESLTINGWRDRLVEPRALQ